jgi:hypothetical protein
MIEIIDESNSLSYKEKKQIFNAIALSILRSSKTFDYSSFEALGRLHSIEQEVMVRLFNGFIKNNIGRRFRKIESLDKSVTLYEII